MSFLDMVSLWLSVNENSGTVPFKGNAIFIELFDEIGNGQKNGHNSVDNKSSFLIHVFNPKSMIIMIRRAGKYNTDAFNSNNALLCDWFFANGTADKKNAQEMIVTPTR